jgi:NAD(P)-dependent dehydrogenase (short-subunit alcohol dehydrogenase family)
VTHRERARAAIKLGRAGRRRRGERQHRVASNPGRGGGIYGACKAALELLTRIWAFGPQGVRVNAVAAGATRTLGSEDLGRLSAAATLATAARLTVSSTDSPRLTIAR